MDTNDMATKSRPAPRKPAAAAAGDGFVEKLAPSSFAAITGTLVSIDADGVALIDLPAGASVRPLAARSCVDLVKADVGKEVVLVFEDGDRSRPLVIGLLRDGKRARKPEAAAGALVEVDGAHVTLTGKESVTLRCGAASITLRADGKITIRAGELESRASGLNRIQGGSVRIN